jgi:2-methylcitrate dehydratase
MVRYLDFNDAYIGSHPSDNVPAVLAAAEAHGASGRDLITGCALAYEVQAAWVDSFSLREGAWDQATYSAISMPLGAGKVMGLTRDQLADALRIAVVGGMALGQARRENISHWKAAAVPNTGRNGIFAAMLARRGFTGPESIFEGIQGFFAGISGKPVEMAPLAGENGNSQPFRILESRVKRFPAGIFSQTAVEGALEARERLGIATGTDVRAVHIRTFEQAVFAMAGHPSRWRPETRETADHSIPFVVACALQFGAVEPKHFDEETLGSPELVALMQKITVVEDPECEAAWPDATLSIVDVETADGRRHTSHIPYHLGHSKRAVGDADIETKFRGLAQGLLDDQQQTAALSALWKIEEATNLRDVMDLLAVAGHRGS